MKRYTRAEVEALLGAPCDHSLAWCDRCSPDTTKDLARQLLEAMDRCEAVHNSDVHWIMDGEERHPIVPRRAGKLAAFAGHAVAKYLALAKRNEKLERVVEAARVFGEHEDSDHVGWGCPAGLGQRECLCRAGNLIDALAALDGGSSPVPSGEGLSKCEEGR